MRAQELRIGNIVSFKNRTDCYCTVNELGYAGGIHLIRTFTDGSEDDQPEVMADITPIPLTEEWLKKLGFRYSADRATMSDGFDEWFLNGIMLGYMDKCYILEALDQGGINMPVKYVHQLMNLYFALTGEELTIKQS